MRTADVLTAVVLIGLGGVVMADAVRLGIGWGTDGPASGFFPFWLAITLVLTSAAILGHAIWRRARGPFATRERLLSVLTVLWPAAALVVLTEFLGLYVASALYTGLYMRWIGRHRWSAVLPLAIGIPLVTFVVFERWFLLPMPKGPLEQWLGY